jgi:hypothetical protein
VKLPTLRRGRRLGLAALACAACCVIERAVLGAFGSLTLGAVAAELTELVPVLGVGAAVALAVLVVRRRRRGRSAASRIVLLPTPQLRQQSTFDDVLASGPNRASAQSHRSP